MVTEDPEDLWKYLARYEAKTGGQILAIPHNGNWSNGTMFTEQTVGEIENVDIAESISRMQSATVTLEASFMTLARLSQLTLLNFLR